MVSDRRRQRFAEEVGYAGRRSETSRRQRGAGSAGVVVAAFAGDVADPGNIVSRASRGKHGRGQTPAHSGRVEDDGRFGAEGCVICCRGAHAPRVLRPVPSPASISAQRQRELRFGEGAKTSTRGACAPLTDIARRGGRSTCAVRRIQTSV